jgi:hypothetical protein
MPRPSHSPCLDNRNNIQWNVQVKKVFIMQSSPASLQFLPFIMQGFMINKSIS